MSSTGVSFNIGGTLNIRIKILLLTLNIQPGANGSQATTGTTIKMADMNGDGAPDHIFKAPGTDDLYLRVNQMDKVGTLKAVNLPQGGRYDFEYSRTTNTILDPNSRWYLSKLTKSDGYQDAGLEGAHSYTTTFDIGNGQYDRQERKFYGFDSTTTHFADGSYAVKSYYNDEYYRKGKLSKTALYSSENKLLSETNYSYMRVYPHNSASSFYKMIQETTRTYTTTGTSYIETNKEYDYDSYGNITELKSTITGADSNQNYLLKIGYATLPGYIVGLPETLEAYNGLSALSSNLLRKRTAEYDTKGNLLTLRQYDTGFHYSSTTLTYDDYGNIKSVTDPLGYTVAYDYDADQNQFVTTITSKNSGGGPVYTSSMTWNKKFGVETSSTEINGNTQTKEYDSFGRLVSIRSPYDTGPLPAVSYSYFTSAFPWRAVSSNKVSFDPGHNETMETVITIDGLGRITQTAKEGEITLPDGTKQHGWNRSGAVIYDAKARTVKEGQTQFEQLNYTLPIDLSEMPSASPLTRPTITEYDTLDRPVKVTLPDGSQMVSSYPIGKISLQGAGLMSGSSENQQGVVQTDPEGNKTEIWKNGRGMITAIIKRDSTNKVATEVSYRYNLLGELQKSQDYMGNRVSFTYDLLGRQLTTESPDTGRQEFTYNDAGQVIKKTDANLRSEGKAIFYEYDLHNRLTKIDYPEQQDIIYSYGTDTGKNNLGRLASVTNESGTTSYEYGKMGEITSLTRSINRLAPNTEAITATLGYQSDYLGRMESITYPDGEVLTYSYDQGGQINGASSTRLGKTFHYVDDIGYDEYGQRVYIKYGNGTETNYTYDEDRRWLSNIKTSLISTGSQYQNMDYGFDRAGNILTTVNETLNHSVSQTYGYDALYQLTSAEGSYGYHSTGGMTTRTSNYTQSFSYDKIGNMLRKDSHENKSSSGVSALDYNSLYSYYKDAPHRVEQIGDMYYRYDQNGNTVEERIGGHRPLQEYDKAEYSYRDNTTIANQAFAWTRDEETNSDQVYSRQYFWDEENRLKGTTDPNHWTQYTYDADGQRTLKYSDLGETLYFDSMWSIADTNTSEGLRQSKSIYIGETRIATKLNYKDTSDLGYETVNTYYYHTDHLSSSNVITDPDGNVYEHLEYTPYGEMWVNDQKAEDLDKIPFRFTAKEWDEETKLYYMSARYQNPMTSRWISADPAGYGLVNPMGEKGNLRNGFSVVEATNWYSYTSNNPLKYRDPTGMNGDDVTTNLVVNDQQSTDSLNDAVSDFDYAGEKTKFNEGISANEDFTATTSACDNYGTKVLEDGGAKPDNWLDPNSNHPADRNIPGYGNYVDDYFGANEIPSNTSPVPGINALVASGGNFPNQPHFILVFKNSNDTLDYTHYSGGSVETVRGVSQSDLEGAFGYSNFQYFSLSP